MKKFLSLLMVLAMTVMLAACGAKEAPAPAAENAGNEAAANEDAAESSSNEAAEEESADNEAAKTFTIGYSALTLGDSYCKALADAIEKYAKEMGMECTVLDGQVDATKQMETIDTFYNKKVDLVIVQPIPGVESSLVKFNESGTPVLFVNSYPTITEEFELSYSYVGSRETEAGEEQAKYLAEVLPENATVCVVLNALGFTNTESRRNGFVDKMNELRPDVQVIAEQTGDSDTNKTMSVIEDWLQLYGEDGINAIVSGCNASTIGIVEVLKSHDLCGKILVAGIDCLSPYGPDNLTAGNVAVDIFQNPDEQARIAIETALKLLEGEAVEEETWVKWEPVTAENAKDYYDRY